MPPQQKQIIEVAFGQGLDTKTDPIHLPSGRFEELRNATFQVPGQIQKGPRLRQLTNLVKDIGRSNPDRRIVKVFDLASMGDEVLLSARPEIISTPESDGCKAQGMVLREGLWVPVGEYIPARTRVFTAHPGDNRYVSCSVAALGEYVFVVFSLDALTTGEAALTGSIIHWPTGRLVADFLPVGDSGDRQKARVCTQGTAFAAYAGIPGSGELSKTIYDMDGGLPGNGVTTSPFTDYAAADLFDVVSINREGDPNNGVHYVAYQETVVGSVTIHRVGPDGTVTHTVAPVPGFGATEYIICLTMFDGTSTNLFVAWKLAGTGTILYSVWDADDLSLNGFVIIPGTTPQNKGLTVMPHPARDNAAASRAYFVHDSREGTTAPRTFESGRYQAIEASDGSEIIVPFDSTSPGGFSLVAHGFAFDNQGYGVFTHDFNHPEEVGHFVAGALGTDDDAFHVPRPIARVLSSRGNLAPSDQGGVSKTIEVAPGVFVWAALRQDRLRSDGEVLKSVTMCRLEMGKPAPAALPVGRTVYLPGGFLWQYDGKLAEVNFHQNQEQPVVSSTPTTLGSMSDGTYVYLMVLEWHDRNGDVHRSALSETTTVVLSGGTATQRVVFGVAATHVVSAAKLAEANDAPGNVRVALYRTEDGGVRFYKSQEHVIGFVTVVDTVSFNDTLSDAELIDNEILYTDGGFLQNQTPPQPIGIAFQGQTLAVLSADDPTRVLVSKPKVPGDGASFNDALFVNVPLDGPGTAIATLDSSFVVMSERSIVLFSGEGFNGLGQGGFTTPQLLSSDVGAREGTPVVSTKNGVYFQSIKGIYILDRSLTAQYVGAPVEAFNDRKVVKAFVDADTQRVVFILDDNETALVLDEFLGQWTVYTIPGLLSGAAATDGVFFARADNTVWQEDPDGEAQGPLFLRTGWVHPFGVMGYGRLERAYVTADFGDGAKLRCKIIAATDTYSEPEETVSEIEATGQITFEMTPRTQRCSGFKFELEEIEGDVRSVSAIRFEVLPEPKRTLPEGQKI